MTQKDLASLAQSGEHLLRNWKVVGLNPDQVERVPGHYNNVGSSARLKTSFEINPVTEGKQGTLPYLTVKGHNME